MASRDILRRIDLLRRVTDDFFEYSLLDIWLINNIYFDQRLTCYLRMKMSTVSK